MATRRRDNVPRREMRATLTNPGRLPKSSTDPSIPAHLNPTLHSTKDVPKQHDKKLSPVSNLAKDRRTNIEKKTPIQNSRHHPSINQTLWSPASPSQSPHRSPLSSMKTIPSPKPVKSRTISSSRTTQSKTIATPKPVQGKTIVSPKPVQSRTIANKKPVQGKTTQKPSKDKNSKTPLQPRNASMLKKRGPSIGVMKEETKTMAAALKETVASDVMKEETETMVAALKETVASGVMKEETEPVAAELKETVATTSYEKDTRQEAPELDSPYQELSSSEAEEQTIEVVQSPSYQELSSSEAEEQTIEVVQSPSYQEFCSIEAENNDEGAELATAEPLTVLEHPNDIDVGELEDKLCIEESTSMEKETEELIVEEINKSNTDKFDFYDDSEEAKEEVLVVEETIIDKEEETTLNKEEETAMDHRETLPDNGDKLQQSWQPEKRVDVEDFKNEPEKPRVLVRKDSAISNDVIEETASMLREQRKNRVRALAGAFETVISLQ